MSSSSVASIVVSATVTPEEWGAYVSKHPEATVDHQWSWREVIERVFGQKCLYLAARRGGMLVGVLPLVLFQSRLFGRAAISLPYLNYGGLLVDDDEAAECLLDEARAAARTIGAAYIELRHRRRQFDTLPFLQHKLALTRVLPDTVDTLWSDTDRKVRNQVRKAQKTGLETIVGGVELLESFYTVFARNMRDLGTPVYSPRLFAETLRAFGADACIVIVSSKDAGPMAGAVAVSFRDTTLVPWASSLREFRHLCPNMLLYWTLLERATLERRRVFDFGRSSPGGGTHQFKLQWGAGESPLFWEYAMLGQRALPDHSPTNPKFSAMIALWQRLPMPIANAIGPAIVRNIP